MVGPMIRPVGGFDEILLLEDNATVVERQRLAGVGSHDASLTITVRVHRLNGAGSAVVADKTYEAGSMRSHKGARIKLAARLLSRAGTNGATPVVVAGTSFGSVHAFLVMLCDHAVPFVVQIRPSTMVSPAQRSCLPRPAGEMLDQGEWKKITAALPDGKTMAYSAAKLATITLPVGTAELFAAQVGGIRGVHRGTIIGLSSFDGALTEFVQLVEHARWIRRATRSRVRAAAASAGSEPSGAASKIPARANIALARRQDARIQGVRTPKVDGKAATRRKLRQAAPILNVVELFSGAGGMGLGFLLGGGNDGCYRIVYSGEANQIFVKTLRRNHQAYNDLIGHEVGARTPAKMETVDLREKRVLDDAVSVAKEAGGTHLLIGGPPCQGFSMANRNSWSSSNPNNQLIDTFIKYITRLRPLAFLLENVQGILWTSSSDGTVSVVDVIERRLKTAGYLLFPKLLDAVWYGVPQYRTRFFLMGLHRDLEYTNDDFGGWGPFPQPTHGVKNCSAVTVRDAIADLPQIGNGHFSEFDTYKEPSRTDLRRNEFLRFVRLGANDGIVFDHVTSRHADYVIQRYRKIPAGGNWESIREDLTNYADVSRTHSNIYRRLRWDEPSITIGHYRKSMLIHPSQHRGLSLREAARLQSFPDWFRFVGSSYGKAGGLVHKQQQLANAVCPLVTKAIAEFIRNL